MSARPWYPRYPRDFRAKTLHLSLLERGAYTALIDHYYELGAALPAEPEALYRIAGAYALAEREAVDRVAKEFFVNGGGHLNNARCDEELAKMRIRSAQQSDLAKRRWQHAKAKPTHSQGNASHSHISQSQSEVQSESENTKSKTKTKAPQRADKLPELPYWLPLDAWRDWLAMRVRIRKPATARAQRMALGNLEQLREAGEDPNQVICKAINKCWLEFWPLDRPK